MGGRQKQALNIWSRKENEDPAGQRSSSCLHPAHTGGGKASPGGLGVPVEGTGGTPWQRCHLPGMLAGDITAHSFTSTTIPPTEDMQLSQLTRVLRFALVFRTTGEAELCPILPPARSSLPSAQHRLQLSQPFQVTKSHSFFFSFSLLSQEVGGGGGLGRSCGERRSAGLSPSLSWAAGQRGRTGWWRSVAGWG